METRMKRLLYMAITCLALFFIASPSSATDPCEESVKRLGYDPWELKQANNLIKKAKATRIAVTSASAGIWHLSDVTVPLKDFILFVEDTKEYECGITKINEALDVMQASKTKHALMYIFGTLLERRAHFYMETQNYENAQLDYEELIEKFSSVSLRSQYAWFLATCPESRFRDGKRALGLAEEGIKTNKGQKSPDFQAPAAVAAAFAELGDFKKAVKYQKEAIENLKEYLRRAKKKSPSREEDFLLSPTIKQYKMIYDKYPNLLKEKLRTVENLPAQHNKYLEHYKQGKPWRGCPTIFLRTFGEL